MDNIDWKGVNANDLVKIANIGTLELKGKVTLEGITIEQLNVLMDIFGESAFDKNADFFINAPDAIFVTGRTEILEGESEDYDCVVFGGEVKRITWSIYSGGSSYTTLNAETGVLSTTEGGGNRNLVIRVIAVTDSGTKSVDTAVTIKARTYPSSSQTSISGPSRLESARTTYKLAYTTSDVNGDMIATWTLLGMEDYAEIESYTDSSCVVKKIADTTSLVQGTLSCTLKKRVNNSTLFTITKTIEILNESIAETDIGIVTALYNAGFCANPSYITKDEASLITAADLQPGTDNATSIFFAQSSKIKSFEGFQYFTSVINLPSRTFIGCTFTGKIVFPTSLTEVDSYAFYDVRMNEGSIIYQDGAPQLNYLGFQFYSSLHKIKEIHIPNNWNSIPRLFADYCREVQISLLSGAKGVSKLSYWGLSSNTNLGDLQPWRVTTVENKNLSLIESNISEDSNIFIRYDDMSAKLGGVTFMPNSLIEDSIIKLMYNITFDDGTQQQKLLIEETSLGHYKKVVNKFSYPIIINSNKDTQFSVSYTDCDNNQISFNAGVGETRIYNFPHRNTQITLTGLEDYEGYITPSLKILWRYSSSTSSNTFNMKYKEMTEMYLQHKDNSLYTAEEWVAAGFTKEDVNGIACIRPFSGSFVVPIDVISDSELKLTTFGPSIAIPGYPYGTSSDYAFQQDAYERTQAILAGTVDSGGSPAAEYATNYIFPNGVRGFLPSSGMFEFLQANASIFKTLWRTISENTQILSSIYLNSCSLFGTNFYNQYRATGIASLGGTEYQGTPLYVIPFGPLKLN